MADEGCETAETGPISKLITVFSHSCIQSLATLRSPPGLIGVSIPRSNRHGSLDACLLLRFTFLRPPLEAAPCSNFTKACDDTMRSSTPSQIRVRSESDRSMASSSALRLHSLHQGLG